MSIEFNTFLPTYGDGRNIVNPLGVGPSDDSLYGKVRASDPYYLTQLARAAEGAGFKGVLLPIGFNSEDTFIATALVAQQTRSLEFIVAFRAGLTLPSVVAQMTATLQRASGGRVHLNITSGGSPADQRAYGDFLEHDDRYHRVDDFLTVLGKLYSGEPFTHEGPFYRSEVSNPVDFAMRPLIHMVGASEVAKDYAARHGDIYLMYGETPPAVRQRVAEMRERAARYGRSIRCGITMPVIARETEAAAYAEAQRHLDTMDQASIAKVQTMIREMDSVGQQRISGFHQGRKGSVEELLIHPNIWAGIGLIRGGSGTALLGSHAQVAERIDEYIEAGIESFILFGYPALKEAYRIGELILPLVSGSTRNAGAFAKQALAGRSIERPVWDGPRPFL